VVIKTDDKNKKIFGDDFNYYCSAKSYNLAMPKLRNQIQNQPYLMAEPKLVVDYQLFSEQSLSQCQLLYFYINPVIDY